MLISLSISIIVYEAPDEPWMVGMTREKQQERAEDIHYIKINNR
jgi:phenylpyruvate tautomerase PptA (4-oxalocrotonate tautomerase family)